MRKITLIVGSVLLALNCGSSTKYGDPTKADGSREWGPKEVKITVNKMVASLYNNLKAKKTNVFLDVAKIRNRTSEHIDTKMLANELTTSLIRKRIKFIDRNQRDAAIKEIEMGQTGLVDEAAAIPAGELKSPNFILNGDITDNVRYVDGDRIQYLVVTLRLTKLATTEVSWQEQQQFLKKTKEEKISW